jgi:hypothetical protein
VPECTKVECAEPESLGEINNPVATGDSAFSATNFRKQKEKTSRRGNPHMGKTSLLQVMPKEKGRRLTEPSLNP